MDVTHEQLETFRVAAELLNFTETGRRLHLAQPTISQQIKALERQVGELFDRSGRGLKLTAAGEALYPFAKRVHQELEAAQAALRELKGEVAGPLRLGASTTIGNYWLPPLLVDFRAAHPRVEIALAVENSTRLLGRLHEGDLHLVLLEGTRPAPGDPDLVIEPFMEDHLILVAGPPMATPGSLTLGALQDLPWVLREPGSGTREVILQVLSSHGLDVGRLAVALELGSTEAIKQAVAAGSGIACISELTIVNELASGTIRPLAIDGIRIPRPLWLVRPLDRYLGPAGRAFLKALSRASASTAGVPLDA